MSTRTISQVIGRARALLLDFDGPVCRVFARYPARRIAAELRDLLAEDHEPAATDLADERDPFEVLRYTDALHRPGLTRRVEDALRAAELSAAQTAAPTPYAQEAIVAARRTRRLVAIVSNNSEPAICAYLHAQRLADYVDAIVGRPYAEPSRMKPNPAPIADAAPATALPPSCCVLVGDSPSDVDAARAAGSAIIGYANKPGKNQRLAHADVTIETMADLADALLSAEPSPVPKW